MSPGDAVGGEGFDVAYLVLNGTTTAARCPELLRGLVGLGFPTVIEIPTPNASRVIASRDLADVEGVQVVESYFDLAIRPRSPRGVVLFAPCSFNSLNKLAHGVADNLGLSVVAEAIGRGHASDCRPVAECAAPEPSRGAGIAPKAAHLGRDNCAACRRGSGTAPRPVRTTDRCRSSPRPARLTQLTFGLMRSAWPAQRIDPEMLLSRARDYLQCSFL